MAKTKSEKIAALASSYMKTGKVKFEGVTYPIFKANNLPLIEDVAHWVEHNLMKNNFSIKGIPKPISYLQVGEMFYTTSKQLWCITQSWIQNDCLYMTARKLYPRKGEDNRMFSEKAEKGSKASIGITVKQTVLVMKDSGAKVSNIRQLKRN